MDLLRVKAFRIIRELTALPAGFRPVAFCRHVLAKAHLRKWQRRFLRRIGEQVRAGKKRIRVLLTACPGAGKTFVAAVLLIMVMVGNVGAKGLTLAYSYEGVNDLLWSEVRRLWAESPMLSRYIPGVVYPGKPLLSFGEEWFAKGRAVEKTRAEKLRGMHGTVGIRIPDEASSVPEEFIVHSHGLLVDSPISFDIATTNCWDKTTWAYRLDVSGDEGLIRETISIVELIEAGDLPEDAFDQAASVFGSSDDPRFRALYLCEYLDADPYSAIRVEAFDACVRLVRESEGEKVVGIDLACSEDQDETAIACAHGLDIVRPLFTVKTTDHPAIAREAIRLAKDFGAEVIAYDSQGVGGPFGSTLRREGWEGELREFVASSSPRQKDRFSNWYAEAATRYADAINSESVRFPADETLRSQALQVRFVPVSGGKVSADKKAGHKSPDRFDACLIATCGKKPSDADLALEQVRALNEERRRKREEAEKEGARDV